MILHRTKHNTSCCACAILKPHRYHSLQVQCPSQASKLCVIYVTSKCLGVSVRCGRINRASLLTSCVASSIIQSTWSRLATCGKHGRNVYGNNPSCCMSMVCWQSRGMTPTENRSIHSLSSTNAPCQKLQISTHALCEAGNVKNFPNRQPQAHATQLADGSHITCRHKWASKGMLRRQSGCPVAAYGQAH
jgi:hypothetical protein